ncbi:MAG: universal stress protein [Ginsengibacter sp.]
MKTVLIATDFSRASRNASLYGMAFAKSIDAKIYLFNSYRVPNPAPGLGTAISRYDIMMQTDKRLLEEANAIDAEGKQIEIICDEGETGEAIVKLAMEKSVDFIIVGMKGNGKNVKKIFGSTATALAVDCRVPVIIVPEEAKYRAPKIIVYASDSVVADTIIPVTVDKISSFFNSKVFVVKVVKDKPGGFHEENKNSDESASNASFKYIPDNDVSHGLNSFVIECGADMLVMIPHKHELIEKLFKKSETKDMIFQTKIPLVILPESQANIHLSLQKENMEGSC